MFFFKIKEVFSLKPEKDFGADSYCQLKRKKLLLRRIPFQKITLPSQFLPSISVGFSR